MGLEIGVCICGKEGLACGGFLFCINIGKKKKIIDI